MSLQLTIKDLSKTYPNGVQALKNVSLQIPTGMFGLLGPNGAGKSTLMRTIATLQEPDTGTVTLGDLDVVKQKHEVRKILGYLPQEFGIYPKMSGEAMLSHFAVLKGIHDGRRRKEVVDTLLHQTNLWEVRKQALGGYSGGMRQRFGIAQALIGDPKLVIVDEPTAGLDPGERNRFHNLLAEIGENIIVILSTHIVEDVSDLCRKMAIISHGNVLLTGEPLETIANMKGQIWKKMIEKDHLEQYEEEYSVISTRLVSGRTQIHILSTDDPGNDFVQVDPDLEDVYFSTLDRASELAA